MGRPAPVLLVDIPPEAGIKELMDDHSDPYHEEATKIITEEETPLRTQIRAECEGKRITPEIVMAVIEVESKGNPQAIGDGGDSLGLMQIQPKWHRARMERLGVDDLLDPEQNIKVGVDILEELLEKYQDIDAALTAYNVGHDDGSRDYANRVRKEMEK